MALSPDEIRILYDEMSIEDKLVFKKDINKNNKSWAKERLAVKKYLDSNGSMSLAEARDVELVPESMVSSTFVKCIIKPLIKEGYMITEQKGVLSRGAILYHTPGNASKGVVTKQVFDEPNEEAAKFVVTILMNGFTGKNIDARQLMEKKQFPFISIPSKLKSFKPRLIDEAGKHGWDNPRAWRFNKRVKL